MQNQNPNVEAQYKTIAIVWFGLFMAQIMFLVVLLVAKPEVYRFDFSKPPLGENPILVIALAILGVLTFLLSFVMKKKFLAQAVSQQSTAHVQTAVIIACALCEATTLFGLVLAFTIAYQFFFAWFALGLLGTILHFPKRGDLIAASCKK